MEIKLPDGFDNREEAIKSLIKKSLKPESLSLLLLRKALGNSFLIIRVIPKTRLRQTGNSMLRQAMRNANQRRILLSA